MFSGKSRAMSENREKIPFNKPCLEGNELENIQEAISLGKLAGDGYFGRACEKEIEKSLGAKKVLLTNSGTDALELSALLCGIGPGDEVIMPSFTFVSTANAFCLRGASPVFVDISPHDLNVDPRAVEAAVTERTKAIVPVHYAGVACNMEEINSIARRNNLMVVEDAAHGYLASCNGDYLGTMGDLGCFSFHETKTFICGEGGAIVINREDLISPAEIMREKGTNRTRFFRGEVDKYSWVSLGSSFLPSELVSGFLYGQLQESASIVSKRRRIYEQYEMLLEPLVDRGLLEVGSIPDNCTVNYHMYYVLTQDAQTRTRMLKSLNEAGISAVFHYVPLHQSEYAKQIGIDASLPVTEDIADRLVRLPFFNCMTDREQAYVVEKVYEFFGVEPTGRLDL